MLKKLIFFALLGSMAAQVKVTPLPPPKTCLESAGTILSGGSVSTFAAGTTTPLASYTDSTGTVSNANPVVLDAAGCANIWLGPSSYKIVVKRSDGTTVYTTDGINGAFLNFLSLNGGNALTAIADPTAALGLFWLSTNNAGRLKWADASAVHIVVGADTTDTLTNKTLTSPTVTGGTFSSPTMTGTTTVAALTASGSISANALVQANAGITVTGAAATITQAAFPRTSVSLANGANNDIALGGATFVRIQSPTGAFSVSGFSGGTDGRILYLLNPVSQTMTITNNAGSSAGNRITTLTGADVVLRANLPSFATFIYDSSSTSWILVATN